MDDPAALPEQVQSTELVAAVGGIDRAPATDEAVAARGWHVFRKGTSLWLGALPGTMVIVR